MRPSVAVGATQRRFNPSALLSATNFDGASTEATAAGVSDGEAEAVCVGSADCEIEGAGAAASSPFDPDLDQTIAASKTIPTTTAKTTRLDAPCLGAAIGFAAFGLATDGDVTGAGRDDVRGTGGTEILEVEVLDALFLTARLAGAFLAVFLATFFVAAFLAGAFLATRLAVVFFLAADFFTAFFGAAFFAGAFLATFFAALFFFTATITPWIAVRTLITCVYRTRLPQAPMQLDDMRSN